MNANFSPAQVAKTLIDYRFRLPVYAEGGCIYDSDGDLVFPKNPAEGPAAAQRQAEEFCARINRPDHASYEAGFACSESV